jgi:methionyl-tRNA formyltransferase
VHDRLAALGGAAIVEALDGTLTPKPQPAEGVTYAAKISPEEARLDWQRPAADLERMVRAFNPVPGAWTTLPNGERLKILSALVSTAKGAPGTILDEHLTLACAENALKPLLVQRQGKKPMATAELLRGLALKSGQRLA